MTPTNVSRVLFVYIPFIAFGVFGIKTILIEFDNIDVDSTTKLTNIGFAILGALSAICFSWSRAIANDVERQHFALIQGERSLLAAVIFLIGSGCKYMLIQFAIKYPDFLTGIKIFSILITTVTFGFAISLAYWILFRITLELWKDGFVFSPKDGPK